MIIFQTYRLRVFFTVRWTDSRLMFPSNNSFLEIFLKPELLQDLWTPDFIFKNVQETEAINFLQESKWIFLNDESEISLSI